MNCADPVAAETLDAVPVTVKVTVWLLLTCTEAGEIEAMPGRVPVGAVTVTAPLKPVVTFTVTTNEPGKALNNGAVVAGIVMVNGSCAVNGKLVEAAFVAASVAVKCRLPAPAPEPLISNTTVAEPAVPLEPTVLLEPASTTTEPTPLPLHELELPCPRRMTAACLPRLAVPLSDAQETVTVPV